MFMVIDLSEYIGEVKNDTGVWGKAFIFNVITERDNEPYTFECILFVHKIVESFITLNDEDQIFDKDIILKLIFEKYTLTQLLEVV